MEKSQQFKYHSPLGDLFLVATARALQGLYWEEQLVPYSDGPLLVHKKAVSELEEYFKNMRTHFTVPLDLKGTPFQLSVWEILKKIPYGSTVTYKDIACSLGNEKSARAVGLANGLNPLCIIVPCHRVLASDGSLTGFSGGLERKKRLLDLERGSSPPLISVTT